MRTIYLVWLSLLCLVLSAHRVAAVVQVDSTIALAEEAFAAAKNKQPLDTTFYNAGSKLAADYYRNNDWQKALDVLNELQPQTILTREQKLEVQLFRGKLKSRMARYTAALEELIQVTKLADSLYLPLKKADALSLIGIAYGQQGQRVQQHTYYNEALKIYRQERDLRGIGQQLSNIAILHYYAGDLKNSIQFYLAALAVKREANDIEFLPLIYSNLGTVYTEVGLPDSALYYYSQGELELSDAEHHVERKAYLAMSKAETYITIKRFYKAEKEALHALELAKQLPDMRCWQDAYEVLASLYEEWGKPKESLHYYKQYYAIRDSIFRPKLLQEKERLLQEFEAERRQFQIKALENEKAEQNLVLSKQQQFIYFTIFGLFMLLGLALYITRNNRKLTAARKKLQELNDQLNTQNFQLQDLNSTKDKFFSIIAHDLRGPVSGFQMLPYIMREAISSNNLAKLQSLVEAMAKSTTHLSALLEGLLTWAQTQTGSMPYDPTAIPSEILLNKVFTSQVALAHAKGVELIIAQNQSFQIWVDVNSAEAALRNLVHNAIKFSSQGQTISLSCQVRGRSLVFVIKDEGVGIPREMQAKLFSPASKFQRKGTNGEKGTGLGLLLVDELVRLNKGTIAFKSELGEGTTFYVEFPLAEVVYAKTEELV